MQTANIDSPVEQTHTDKLCKRLTTNSICKLLAEASPQEKKTILILAITDFDLPIDSLPYLTSLMTLDYTDLVQTILHDIRHNIGEKEKVAITRSILDEMFPPGEDDGDDDGDEEEEEGDEAIAAALKAEDLNKALRLAAALDEQRDFAAFRAEAIAASH